MIKKHDPWTDCAVPNCFEPPFEGDSLVDVGDSKLLCLKHATHWQDLGFDGEDYGSCKELDDGFQQFLRSLK